MKHSIIWKEKDRYCSFPHIAYLPDGKLAVVFRKASKFSSDSAKSGIATHHDPDSSIEWITSSDNGLTWDKKSQKTIYKSHYGVNDPALTILKDGTILVRFVALDIQKSLFPKENPKKIFSHRTEHGLLTTVAGNLVIASKDNGTTWEELSLTDCPEIGPSCSRDPIVEMPDESWLMPVYTGAPQRSDISWVIRSFDKGKSWCSPIRIMHDEKGKFSQLQGINYNETSLLHLGKGELLAIVRSDADFHTEDEFMPVGGVGGLSVARSFDSGMSWTYPVRTGIWGQPGSIIQLSNGNILCTYGYRKSPFGVRCCISYDCGITWDIKNEIIVRDDCPTWDCGYPFTIELNDGNMYTVYYFVDNEGTRHICGTNWKIK